MLLGGNPPERSSRSVAHEMIVRSASGGPKSVSWHGGRSAVGLDGAERFLIREPSELMGIVPLFGRCFRGCRLNRGKTMGSYGLGQAASWSDTSGAAPWRQFALMRRSVVPSRRKNFAIASTALH